MKYFEFADKLKPKYSPKYSKYGNGLQINMVVDPKLDAKVLALAQ